MVDIQYQIVISKTEKNAYIHAIKQLNAYASINTYI